MKKRKGYKIIYISILLIVLFTSLYIVSIHSHTLLNGTMSLILWTLNIISMLLLVYGIVKVSNNKKEKTTKKLKLIPKIFLGLFISFYTVGACSILFLLYGPYNGFRDWLVTSAMTTLSHKYLAEWFYNEKNINKIIENNDVVEVVEDTDTNLITFNNVSNNAIYANKYEEEILKKDKGNDLYKIIDIKEKDFKGKMAVIYDPSKVHIAVSKYVGTDVNTAKGEYIYEMEKENNGLLSMNASGFYDPGYNSKGGVPRGVVISKGKLVINNSGYAFKVGGIIGFNKENKLILSKMTASQALKAGIRDAIQYGPFLIVNGKSSYIKGNGGWGLAPRSAIAQRKDGIVLFLVIDGRQVSSVGADMGDMVRVLLKYGAVNAANLDGGTSSALSVNGKIVTNPRNGSFKAKTRKVPDAWIVTKD